MTSQGFIFVRYYGSTYIARYEGKTASCTAGQRQAAERVARKVLGEQPHKIKRVGNNEYTWQVLVEEE